MGRLIETLLKFVSINHHEEGTMEDLVAILVVVVPAMITGIVSIIVCLITSSASRKKDEAEQNARITEIDNKQSARIAELDSKQNARIVELENKIQFKLMELSAAYQQSTALITEKLAELDKKQSIHNGVIERVFSLEKTADVHEEKIKVANNRIADLEHAQKS